MTSAFGRRSGSPRGAGSGQRTAIRWDTGRFTGAIPVALASRIASHGRWRMGRCLTGCACFIIATTPHVFGQTISFLGLAQTTTPIRLPKEETSTRWRTRTARGRGVPEATNTLPRTHGCIEAAGNAESVDGPWISRGMPVTTRSA